MPLRGGLASLGAARSGVRVYRTLEVALPERENIAPDRESVSDRCAVLLIMITWKWHELRYATARYTGFPDQVPWAAHAAMNSRLWN